MEALRLQRQEHAARGAGRETRSGVLSQRVEQLATQISGLTRQIDANRRQQGLIAQELDGVRSLAERGFAPATRIRELERNEASLQGQYGALTADVARAREQIGETRLQMAGVSTELNEEVAEQLRQTEVELNQLVPRQGALRRQIDRATVRSPATGQVIGLTVFTSGGVVQAGQTIMEVVPESAEQLVVVQIKPVDIDNVRIGQDTEVQFPGLRETRLPTLRGRLARVSPDALVNEQTGGRYFRAEVIVPPAELAKIGASARSLSAGTPAQVIIVTRKRTALTFLLEPLVKSLWRAGAEQ